MVPMVYGYNRRKTKTPGTYIQIRVYYDKGDDYVGGRSRGYYASFDVVREEPEQRDPMSGNTYSCTRVISGNGLTLFLAGTTRKSVSVKVSALAVLNSRLSEHLARICAKNGLVMEEA